MSRSRSPRFRRRFRSALGDFANPFVVLADVMVALAFILSLFLLSTTVYSEQMQLIEFRNKRRAAVQSSLEASLAKGSSTPLAVRVLAPNKYQLWRGQTPLLEAEDDGTLQRFRFLGDAMRFKWESSDFENPPASTELLRDLGEVLLRNRARIKSIVIEGQAAPQEQGAWPMSSLRAERVRDTWSAMGVLAPVSLGSASPLKAWMESHDASGATVGAENSLWREGRFNEWHMEEWAAARTPSPLKRGVIPQSWVIVSGRGAEVRKAPIVEFKIEYTEHDALPLDVFLRETLPLALQRRAPLSTWMSGARTAG